MITTTAAPKPAPAKKSRHMVAAAAMRASMDYVLSDRVSRIKTFPNTARFILPLPPNLANTREQWQGKHLLKTAYAKMLNSLLLTGLLPPLPFAPWDSAAINATLYTAQRMDMDNLMARLKWPIDTIVRMGYLTDDKPDVLRWMSVPQNIVSPSQPHIIITLIRH